MSDDPGSSPPRSLDEGVGYGRPPKAHRFQKGRSGNPRGRPKGARGHRQILERVAFERHRVREGDVTRTYTSLELILVSIRNRAVEGDRQMLKVYQLLHARYTVPPPEQRGGYLVVPGSITEAEWDQLMQPSEVSQAVGEGAGTNA